VVHFFLVCVVWFLNQGKKKKNSGGGGTLPAHKTGQKKNPKGGPFEGRIVCNPP